jgi:hypothetical protein
MTVEDVIRRIVESGVARADELRGCSDEELAVFKRNYQLDLPETYRQYLARLGRSAGKLFAWDHVDADYPAVLNMLDDQARGPEASDEDDDDSDYEGSLLSGVALPDKALVILGRLDEQFHFIICDRADDSPVYYFSEEGELPEPIYGSVVDWLEDWRKGAEDAIRSGYFKNTL